VKRLAELHGGQVAVQSEGEGRGSEFTVRVPEIAKPATAEERAGPAASEARSILLIEDNDDGRETLLALLEMSGHTVEAARDGATGLDKALALAPDVAIVDIGLPVLDGYEVARRLRAAGNRRTLLLALTGYGTEADRARVLAAGFDAHLTKPANVAELLDLIAKWKPEERETGKDWRPVHESNVRPGS
jgi:CheY-like chemotaxis protein